MARSLSQSSKPLKNIVSERLRFSMRKVAIAMLAALWPAWLAVNACDAADKVRISVSSLDAAFLTPAVALKRGFFKEEDIEAEVIRMNANVSITALATGDIDYTTIFGSVVRAAIRGLPVRWWRAFSTARLRCCWRARNSNR